VRSKI